MVRKVAMWSLRHIVSRRALPKKSWGWQSSHTHVPDGLLLRRLLAAATAILLVVGGMAYGTEGYGATRELCGWSQQVRAPDRMANNPSGVSSDGLHVILSRGRMLSDGCVIDEGLRFGDADGGGASDGMLQTAAGDALGEDEDAGDVSHDAGETQCEDERLAESVLPQAMTRAAGVLQTKVAGEFHIVVDSNGGRFTSHVGYNTNTNGVAHTATWTCTGAPHLLNGESNFCEISWLACERERYAFEGWWTKPSGGTQVYDERGYCLAGNFWTNAYAGNGSTCKYRGTENLTVYAHWRKISYVVEFDANCPSDDVTGEVESLEVAITSPAQTVGIPACGFGRELFEFVAWNTARDGSGRSLAPGDAVCDLSPQGSEDVTLYAQWQPKQMNVAVPIALHCVAYPSGAVVGPEDDVAIVSNDSAVCVEVCGLEAEVIDPWTMVAEGDVSEASDVALGMSLGEGARLDFSALTGATRRYGWMDAHASLPLRDVRGEVGSVSGEEREVACLHWSFRPVRESER